MSQLIACILLFVCFIYEMYSEHGQIRPICMRWNGERNDSTKPDDFRK